MSLTLNLIIYIKVADGCFGSYGNHVSGHDLCYSFHGSLLGLSGLMIVCGKVQEPVERQWNTCHQVGGGHADLALFHGHQITGQAVDEDSQAAGVPG